MDTGFQWIDGSFLEEIEKTQNRSPGDIDVITFYWNPNPAFTTNLITAFPDIVNRTKIKADFFVDHFPIDVGITQKQPWKRLDIGVAYFPIHEREFGKGCSELTSTRSPTILQQPLYSQTDHDQQRKSTIFEARAC
jgi:hypothetical protein